MFNKIKNAMLAASLAVTARLNTYTPPANQNTHYIPPQRIGKSGVPAAKRAAKKRRNRRLHNRK